MNLMLLHIFHAETLAAFVSDDLRKDDGCRAVLEDRGHISLRTTVGRAYFLQ